MADETSTSGTAPSGPAGPVDLRALADEHLTKARNAAHERSAHLVLRSGPLRQSVIALLRGAALGEHESPVAASLQVLRGQVRVTAESGTELTLSQGHLGPVPAERHDLVAITDAVVVLTTVTNVS
ncbi:cupin [Streptomyces monticola]|uniref:Cupin n=1 Tax=Streptomyces monticola TaxID=2666263 RepID=A0ABW2JF51_9ACTN